MAEPTQIDLIDDVSHETADPSGQQSVQSEEVSGELPSANLPTESPALGVASPKRSAASPADGERAPKSPRMDVVSSIAIDESPIAKVGSPIAIAAPTVAEPVPVTVVDSDEDTPPGYLTICIYTILPVI